MLSSHVIISCYHSMYHLVLSSHVIIMCNHSMLSSCGTIPCYQLGRVIEEVIKNLMRKKSARTNLYKKNSCYQPMLSSYVIISCIHLIVSCFHLVLSSRVIIPCYHLVLSPPCYPLVLSSPCYHLVLSSCRKLVTSIRQQPWVY
jgi:hypothetical protein